MMFFELPSEIARIAAGVGTSVFVVPDDILVEIKGAFILQPEEKTTITIEQVRKMLARFNTKQLGEQFVLIRPADKLGPEASNAFLKNLEEPGEHVHFVLITSQPSKLLPTILSRANVYFLRTDFDLKSLSHDDGEQKLLAKKLIAARPKDLVGLAQEIAGRKTHVRSFTLDILGLAIEMLYKSYFLTQKEIFLGKLPKFLLAYENISKNGNIKLHLVADLC